MLLTAHYFMDNRLTETAATTHDAFKEGTPGSMPLHQYEFLFEMTTQLLAAQKLDEQLPLMLDTITTGLGYSQAARARRLSSCQSDAR